MGSTFPSTVQSPEPDHAAPTTLRWRKWPLVDDRRWSWVVLVGVLALGGGAGYLSHSWLVALSAVAGLAATLWQFFLPIRYEISSRGLWRTALGRSRFVPWHAIRGYQLRASGAVLYQCSEPGAIDLLRSMFLPYPAEEDEVVAAVRHYLSHADEVPT